MVSTANLHLDPVPGPPAVLAALVELYDEQQARPYPWEHGITANAVSYRLGVQGARRAGRGAVKGSWSGRMSGALRVAPVLASLCRNGYAEQLYDRAPGARSRRIYFPSEEGRRWLARQQ